MQRQHHPARNDHESGNKYLVPSYPFALWPLILYRLLMQLEFPSYGFLNQTSNGRLTKEKGLFDRCNENHQRRASIIYHLLLKGVAADLSC